MRVRLDPLGDVPRQPIAVDEVVHCPEGDVGIIGEPGVADDERGKSRQEHTYQHLIFRCYPNPTQRFTPVYRLPLHQPHKRG